MVRKSEIGTDKILGAYNLDFLNIYCQYLGLFNTPNVLDCLTEYVTRNKLTSVVKSEGKTR